MRVTKITLTPYEFQELRRTKTVMEIAEMQNCSYKALQAWCYRRGMNLKRVTDWEIAEEICTKTPKEIAYEYNVSLKTVYYNLKKLGINPKQQRGIK